jgi:multisubunit Na+/H+ antiporter MnhG subunit
MSLAFLGAIWTLFSGIGFFRNISIYNDNNASKLALFSIILGVLSMVVFVIEVFGIFAAVQEKIPLVRAFAWLSALVVAIISAIGLIDIVVHFTLKDQIINTCTNLSEGDTIYYGGIFGPINGGTVTPAEARDWCNRYWNRDSWSDIITFLLLTFVAGFFATVALAYLRQLLDPTSPANALRGPAQHRMGAFPSHYNPPYNPNYGGGPGYSYPAPQGPPPNQEDAFVPPYENKPPGYVQGDYRGEAGYGKGDYNWSDDRREDDGPSAERDLASRPTPGPFH